MNTRELIKELEMRIGEMSQPTTIPGWSKAADRGPWKIGQAYLIRTCTHYWTGRLVGVGPHELLLKDAAWIPDTGRFHDAGKTGKLDEVEPIERDVIVGRGAIIDAIEWNHDLPMVQA